MAEFIEKRGVATDINIHNLLLGQKRRKRVFLYSLGQNSKIKKLIESEA
jgi:hypothetical protein